MPSAPTGWGGGKGGGYGKGGSGLLSNKQMACPVARPSWEYEWKISARTYGDEGRKEAREEIRRQEAEARDRMRALGEKVDLGAAGEYWEKVAVVKTVSERRAKAVPFRENDRSRAQWQGGSSSSQQQASAGVVEDPWLGIDKEIRTTASSSSSWQTTAASVGGATNAVGQVCFDYQRGGCARGNHCRFSHVDPSGNSRDVAWSADDAWSQNHWSFTTKVPPGRDTASNGSQPIGARPTPRPERSYTAEDKAARAEQRKLDQEKRRAAAQAQAPAELIPGFSTRATARSPATISVAEAEAFASSVENARPRQAAPVPTGQRSMADGLMSGVFQ